jgi:hypothetical protein
LERNELWKAWFNSPFAEVAGKGREAFHVEREYSESKSRVFDLENILDKGVGTRWLERSEK